MVVCQSDASHVSCQNSKGWSTEIPKNPKNPKNPMHRKSFGGGFSLGKLPKGGKWDFLSFKPGEKYIPQVDCTKDQIGISVC